MRRLTTGFALTSLALILASCGSSNTPVASQPASGSLVKFKVTAPYAGSLGSAKSQGLSSLGLSGTLPDAFFNVQVRDSADRLVAFNGGTFDPTGLGDKTVVLNNANLFQQTLLLPAGTYTFENALKDTATSSKLLAYGPKGENTATISSDSAVVRLKFHAVFDKANSTLDSSTNIARLFTNSTFNLSLRPMTSPVGSIQAGVPTTDIGPVTYSLGNPTDGVFNGAGSKIGVNVTAKGTAADSTLNVTASFSAWIRNTGTDTASFVPTSLDFTKAIATNAVVADMLAPVLTFTPVSAASQGSATMLSGTATDDTQVQDIRVYADSQLVASTDASEGVSAITSAANGDWSVSWTPASTGTQTLSVVVSDSSGNESREDQDVTVTVALQDYDLLLDGDNTAYGNFDIPANSDFWVKVNRTTTGNNDLDISTFSNAGSVLTTVTYGVSKTSQTALPVYGDSDSSSIDYSGLTGVIAGAFYVHVTNSDSQPVSVNFFNFPISHN